MTMTFKTVADHLVTLLNAVIDDNSVDEELRHEFSNLLPCLFLMSKRYKILFKSRYSFRRTLYQIY
jgi:hypothetical protein